MLPLPPPLPRQTALRRDARGRALALVAVCAAAGLVPAPAQAVDYNLSAFGTIGWAQSNQPFAYQRSIDEDGSFERDTLAGAQIDVSFSPSIGATLQGRIAASTARDDRYDARLTWGFLSWRPSNDWLLRAGKLRVPLYLNSENTDVGATFSYARLPTEMYSTALTPTTDFTGLSVGWTRPLGGGELTADGYWGKADVPFRVWVRDRLAGVQEPHADYTTAKVEAYGLALTWRQEELALRLGLHQALATTRDEADPLIDTFPFVQNPLGPSYYATSPLLPPGPTTAGTIRNTIVTLGATVPLPWGLKFSGELARRSVGGSKVAPEGTGYYLALLRPSGAWTPYFCYGVLRSTQRLRDFYRAVDGNVLPGNDPAIVAFNASQRGGADGIAAYDQWSWTAGTAWRLSAGQALKLEFQRVRTGEMSALVDAPSGGSSGGRRIDIWSLNYSFVF